MGPKIRGIHLVERWHSAQEWFWEQGERSEGHTITITITIPCLDPHTNTILAQSVNPRWKNGNLRWKNGNARWKNGKHTWINGTPEWKNVNHTWKNGNPKWKNGNPEWKNGNTSFTAFFIAPISIYPLFFAPNSVQYSPFCGCDSEQKKKNVTHQAHQWKNGKISHSPGTHQKLVT